MNSRIFSILKYIFFLGGGFALIWWQLHSMNNNEKQKFYTTLYNANYWVILPIAIMSLLSHISRSIRWKIIMEPLGFKPKLPNLIFVTLAGYLANSAIPRLGELLKCTLLAKYEKLKVDKLIGTILVERSFDLLCYIIFIGLTLIIQANKIGSILYEKLSKLSQLGGSQSLFRISIVIVIAVLIIIFFKFLVKKFPENKTITQIKSTFSGIIEGFKSIKKIKKRKAFFLHTLFIWAMYLGQIFLAFQGIKATQHLGIEVAFPVLTLTTLSMILTPGGLGTFPLSVAAVLSIYSISKQDGEALGWIMWGTATILVIVEGLISFIAIPLYNRKKNESYS
jgi:uncharacterized protein (TIRG00374 family)